MGDNLPAIDLGSATTVIAVDAGGDHTCALLGDGRVKCWGTNAYGSCGLGHVQGVGDIPSEMGDNLPAVDLGTGETAVAISVDFGQTCALLGDGRVKCWGDNLHGALGLGDTEDRGDEPNEMGDNLPAIDLGNGGIAASLTAGSAHACAQLLDGSVKCWGGNWGGELGLGDSQHRGDEPNEMGDNLLAVDLGAGKAAIAISTRYSHSCSRLNDGTLKCWGSNAAGALGLGDTQDRGIAPGQMGDALPSVKLFSDLW